MAGPISSSLRAAARPAGDASARVRLLRSQLGKSAATAVGDEIPRPNPAAAAVAAAPPEKVPVAAPYPVDMDRARALIARVQAEGYDSLAPDELILIDDLREGKAVLSDASSSLGDGNLEQSAVELGDETQAASGFPSLKKGRTKRASKLEDLRNKIDNFTGAGADSEAASPKFVRDVQRKVDALTPEERADLVQSYGDPKEAERRLGALASMAGDAKRDPSYGAAKRLDEAASEVASSGAVRGPKTAVLDGVEPGLAPLVSRFNSLPSALQADIVRRLGPSAREAVEVSGGAARVLPETLESLARPANAADELVQELDSLLADPYHNPETAETLRSLIREAPAADRAAAIAAVRRRRAVEAELRAAMNQASDSSQSLASPGQPSLRGQGAMTPEVALDSPVEPPSWLDDQLGAQREAEAAAANARKASGLPLETRLRMHHGDDVVDRVRSDLDAARASGDAKAIAKAEAASKKLTRDLPLWLKGRDRASGALEQRADASGDSLGQRRHYDDALIVLAGGSRPRAAERLNRSSAEISPDDLAAQREEIVSQFGDEFGGEVGGKDTEVSQADLSSNAPGGGGRIRGGRMPLERVQGAAQFLFGGRNPLAQYGMTPEQIADELLSKGPYEPGTADYIMAREQAARNIEKMYGGNELADGSARDLPAPVSTEPAVPQGTSRDPASIPFEGFRPNVAEQAPALPFIPRRNGDTELATTNRITTDGNGNPVYLNEADLPQPARLAKLASEAAGLRVPSGRQNPFSGVEEFDQRRVELGRAQGRYDIARAEYVRASMRKGDKYSPEAIAEAKQKLADAASELQQASNAFASVSDPSAGLPGLTDADRAGSVTMRGPTLDSFASGLDADAAPVSRRVVRWDAAKGEWVPSSVGRQRTVPASQAGVTVTAVNPVPAGSLPPVGLPGPTATTAGSLPPVGLPGPTATTAGSLPPVGLPGQKPLASDVNLASSATDISDPTDIPPAGPAAPAPSKSYSKAEIKEAADAAREEAIRQASDEGMSRSAAKKAGADAAAKVRKEMEAANATVSKAPATTTAPAPAAASPSLAPVEATAGLPAASTTKVGGDVDGSGSLPPVGDAPATPDAGPRVDSATPGTPEPIAAADDAKKVDDATTSGPKKTSKTSGERRPKPEPNKPRSSLPRWLLGAGAVGGLVALSNMGGSGTGAQASDVPPMPVPPGSDGASLDALSNESAIDRALARIRGSRMGVSVPTTQVIQNWTGRN